MAARKKLTLKSRTHTKSRTLTPEAREQAVTSAVLQLATNDPILIADTLMALPAIRLHGPEHHYLTAAALIAALAHAHDKQEQLTEYLTLLRPRCRKILPASCALFGVCGDVLAVGAALSVWWKVSHLDKVRFQSVQQITARCAAAAASFTGPRCCKRMTLVILSCATEILQSEGLVQTTTRISCAYSAQNDDCIGKACVYFPEPDEAT